MTCPKCSLENPPGAARCDCGHAFEASQGDTRPCPYCAETIQAAAIKCRYCNSDLAASKPGEGRKTSAIGIAAIILGIAGAAAPYFAAVFLVPLAFIFGLIAYGRGERKPAIAGILFAMLGTIGIAYTSQQLTEIVRDPFSAKSQRSFADTAPTLTRVKYDQIEEGMTYEQVKFILGEPGEEISRSDIAGYRTVMYSWKNSNGSNMNAMFQNNRLVNKAQFGLR